MRKLLYLLILLVLPAQVCFGWGGGHALITPPAVAALPQWEKDIWSSISPSNYAYNCDNFLSAGCATAQSIAPYMYGEVGGVYDPPIAACDANSQTNIYHYFAWTSGSLNAYLKRGAKWYFEQTIAAFRSGDINASASLMGSFTHAMEDSTSPYHCLDYMGVRNSYWPNSTYGGANFAFFTLDDGELTINLTGYVPKILGHSVDDAAQEAADRIEAANAYSRSLIQDLVDVHQYDDWENGESGPESDAIQSDMATNDAKLLADVYHTAFYLAYQVPAPWKFMVTCDSRHNGNPLKDHIGIFTLVLDEMVTEAFTHGIEVFIFPGDLSSGYLADSGVLAGQEVIWRNIMQPLYDDANIGLYPIRGNHEMYNVTGPNTAAEVWNAGFAGAYANPSNGPSGEENMTYSFTHKNAFFVGLDQYDGVNDDVAYQRVNQAWLDGQFAGNDQPHVFTYGHNPAFKANHPDCLDDNVSNRDTFWESIKNAGGRTYFCGHDHFYARSSVDDGDSDPNNDIQQYIVGSLCQTLYSWDQNHNGSNSAYSLTVEHYASKFGYVIGEVDGYDVTLTWWERDINVEFPDPCVAGVYTAADTWSYSVEPPDAATASNPSPQSGATDVNVMDTLLEWSPGEDSNTHDVYFGTNESDVADANTTITLGVYKGNVGSPNYPPYIEQLTQYYWRIDEVDNDGNTWKGSVWNFTTGIDPGVATNPDPFDTELQVPGSSDLSLTPLSWTPGDRAASHRIYFGTDEAAVINAVYPEGDVDANGVVNYDDLKVVCDWWLMDLGTSGSGGTLIVGVTDDAAVRASEPDTPQGAPGAGNEAYLSISQGPGAADDSYCMFDISAIPVGQTISAATLTTKSHFNSPTGPTVAIYQVASDAWDEFTVTYNTRPAFGSTITTFALLGTAEGGTAGAPQTDVHDVTAYIAASYTGADSLISFGFDHDGSIGGFIRSKEDTAGPGGTPRDDPALELSVTYAPAPVVAIPYPDISCEGDVDVLDFGYIANDWQEDVCDIDVYQGTQALDSNTYEPPGSLAQGTYYYWRIDEVNQCEVWKGDVWQFKSYTRTR